MKAKGDEPTVEPRTAFEAFVAAILKVPKGAVTDAESKRHKRSRKAKQPDDR